jgi:hypothetical protein
MNDVGAIVGTLILLGIASAATAAFGIAAIRFGIDSRRSADEDRLGRPTRWI